MAKMVYRLFFVVSLLLPLTGWATHQAGGQLEMRAVGDVSGHFKVTVTNYFEDNARAGTINSGQLGIYRKRDNRLMTTFTAYESGQRSSIIYANSFCSTQRNLKFISVTFTADLQLSPAQYTDTQGYYLSYQTRNRNGGINNLTNPLQTGFTFYLEFPPLNITGKFINNSSPTFTPVNGEYVCLGEPFTYSFGGTDPDGDELRYSMATPLNVATTGTTAPGPYPTVSYAPGYSAANSVPGSPALNIDARTGHLSVTASQLGLFVFAILIEEYRNGQKIGEVRRDFQFLVVDCPPAQTPNPAAQILNSTATATKTTLCPGESAILSATPDPNWNYQWQRNGINLTNATSNSLTVRDQGEYTVQVSLKNACAKVGNAQSLTVNSLNTKPSLTATGQLCATDGSASLHVSETPDVTYQWLRNGQAVTGQTADSLQTTQPGLYRVVLTHQTLGCQVRSDSILLTRAPAVVAQLRTASGYARLCPDTPLLLTGDGGILYRWAQNAQPVPAETGAQYTAKDVGIYSLTVTDANGCRAVAPPITLSAVAPVSPSLDSLPPFCGTKAAPFTLLGHPDSGTYAGPGMSANVFSPASAGVGSHTLTYSLRPAPECAAVVVQQTAIVYPIPTIGLPDELLTFRGNSLTLEPVLTGDPIRFQWSPGTSLVDSQTTVAQIDNIQSSIVYTLRVENIGRCTATDSIHIDVVSRLFAPDAFTPNGDGQNDQWEVTNIAAFPAVDVTVFNRWGTAVFHATGPDQTPFDGRHNGTELPGGVYTYLIRPDPKIPPMQGRLLLIR
ncbi:gliding motility-associated C-terminal domain-containing protein [Fibrella sp. HMF5335]|uniref:Gliding motility-associated C-terminal domain-containing protein n=1 Tax=Fibrella rubiginis TaxID=2817060 RepID=A0A939GK92_9BACT|nr:gliding motility-associated C-terminal domain-containing protein [Fibrella rubiginis]MBO0938789.1 gliding motility-associated C-terminal domain-containing protein [Fibrella rubiginis]